VLRTGNARTHHHHHHAPPRAPPPPRSTSRTTTTHTRATSVQDLISKIHTKSTLILPPPSPPASLTPFSLQIPLSLFSPPSSRACFSHSLQIPSNRTQQCKLLHVRRTTQSRSDSISEVLNADKTQIGESKCKTQILDGSRVN
jgi:hypothetical protein